MSSTTTLHPVNLFPACSDKCCRTSNVSWFAENLIHDGGNVMMNSMTKLGAMALFASVLVSSVTPASSANRHSPSAYRPNARTSAEAAVQAQFKSSQMLNNAIKALAAERKDAIRNNAIKALNDYIQNNPVNNPIQFDNDTNKHPCYHCK
jgi:hypothetical protein